MNLKPAYRIGLVHEYYFSRKLKEIEEMNIKGLEVINLGIGNPDLPPSDSTLEIAAESILNKKKHGYQSYRGIQKFRKAIAKWYTEHYNIFLNPETEIVPLMGSKEGIFHISMTFLNPGDAVLIPDPGYPTYSSVTALVGGEVIPYPLKEENGWYPDFKDLERTDLSRVKIMWVNYPHMPTGAKPSVELFREIIDFGRRHNILICHDNPYSLILNDEPLSIFSVKDSRDVALELNSLSKSHNMPGWRIGILAGKEEFTRNVFKVISNIQSGMFLPLQEAAVTALNNSASWHKTINSQYKRRQQIVMEILDVLNCRYSSDQAGLFVWACMSESNHDSVQFSDLILDKAQVFITPGEVFGNQGKGYLRISLCNEEKVLKMALERIKNSLKSN